MCHVLWSTILPDSNKKGKSSRFTQIDLVSWAEDKYITSEQQLYQLDTRNTGSFDRILEGPKTQKVKEHNFMVFGS